MTVPPKHREEMSRLELEIRQQPENARHWLIAQMLCFLQVDHGFDMIEEERLQKAFPVFMEKLRELGFDIDRLFFLKKPLTGYYTELEDGLVNCMRPGWTYVSDITLAGGVYHMGTGRVLMKYLEENQPEFPLVREAAKCLAEEYNNPKPRNESPENSPTAP